MADYAKMYYIVCSAASGAIDAEPEQARQLLREALHEAEEIYIQTCEPEEEN